MFQCHLMAATETKSDLGPFSYGTVCPMNFIFMTS